MNKTELKNALRNMNLMTVEELVEKMGAAPCVTLSFYKMDGSLRVMRATRNFKFAAKHNFVTDYEAPTGEGLRYNNTARKLVTVYDLEDKSFKQVPANRMLSVVVG
jgi:hypothetical protein